MKFAIYAVVLLALTMGIQSSVIPGISLNILGAVPAGPTLQQGPVVIGWGASVPVPEPVPSPSVDISSVVGATGATYVAKTLGAVHAAPLPGHTQSAVAVNVDPAPGSS